MPMKTITADGQYNFGIEARSSAGYRTLGYSGDLGGGTLRVFTQGDDMTAAELVPVADSKLSAATIDDNGDVVQQMNFSSSGNVWVELDGATDPDVKVWVG